MAQARRPAEVLFGNYHRRILARAGERRCPGQERERSGAVLDRVLPGGLRPTAAEGAAQAAAEKLDLDLGSLGKWSIELSPGHTFLCQSDTCQSFMRSPDTRPNSLTFRVTSIASLARAMAAISRSLGPMGLP